MLTMYSDYATAVSGIFATNEWHGYPARRGEEIMASSSSVASIGRKAAMFGGATLIVLASVIGGAHLLGLRAVGAASNTITINGADSLGQGLQDVYRLQLSDPAPAGGLQVTLTSSTTTCKLARTEYNKGDGTPLPIIIPPNQRSATFVAQTLYQATGVCSITVDSTTPTGWTTPTLSVPLVQGKLRIQGLAHHIALNADNDPFFVEVGVPAADMIHLRLEQDLSMQLDPLPVKVCSDNTSIGQIANVYGDEAPNGCQQNFVVAPFTQTVPGDFQFDPIAGNDSVDVHVTATAPGFLPDTQSVRVPSQAVTLKGPDKLGAGLQDDYSVRLSYAPLTDQQVTITVSDTTRCAVAATEQDLGDSNVTVVVPAGDYRADFVVQGVTGATPGSCTVSATVVNASPPEIDQFDISVRQPALRIRYLSSTEGQFGPDDPFYVELGVPAELHRLRYVQDLARGLKANICSGVACGAQQLPVTATSNHPETGCIIGPNGQCGAQATANVPLTYSVTVPGDLTFHPVAGASDPVRVTVSAPGFIEDYKDVTVRQSALQLKPVRQPGDIGSLLQDDYKVKLLYAAGHPDTDVTLMANANCLVARGQYAPGASQLVIRIDASHSSARFTVQATGDPGTTCHIDATASTHTDATPTPTPTNNYAPTDIDIDIVQPGIQIRQLARSMPVGADDDPFVVQVGLPNGKNTQLRYAQTLAPKSAPGTSAPFEVCSNDASVGQIVKLGSASRCQSAAVLQSHATNVPGDLKFRPLATGLALVSVTAPGFLTMDPAGEVPVRVGRDSITLSTPSTLGSNLEDVASLRLSKPAGSSGVLVTINADSNCLVAADANSSGQTSVPITITIAPGDNSATFYVSALDGLDDTSCTLSAKASGYIGDLANIDIQQRAFQIVDLDPTLATGSGCDDFTVLLGVQSDDGFAEQPVRIGGGPVPVTVCSSNTNVGGIGTPTNACQSSSLNACQSSSFTQGQSELTFRFLVNSANMSGGQTVVSAAGGADPDNQGVNVSTTSVHLSRLPTDIAKYLQGTYTVYVSNNNGATVTVHAEPSSVCVVSLDPNTQGDGSDRTIPIPNGSSQGSFVLQGIDTGICSVTLSGPGFPSVSRDIPVRSAALRITGLASTMSVIAKSDVFNVEIGPATSDVETNWDNQHNITAPLPVRAGVNSFNYIRVLVCSTNPNAGIIHDALGSPVILQPPAPQCILTKIDVGSSQTGNLTFDPVAPLPDLVTAGAPDYPDIKPTQEYINIKALALNLVGPDAIALNLQQDYTAQFNPAPPDGTTVTVTVKPPFGMSSGTQTCGVWPSHVTPFAQAPASTITLPVPAGQDSVDFWVAALAKPGCTVSIASNSPLYENPDPIDVGIDDPATRLRNLDTTLSTAANEPFNADIGAPTGSVLRLVQQVMSDNTSHGLPVHDATLGVGIPVVVCSDNSMVGTIVGGISVVSIPEISCNEFVFQEWTGTISPTFHPVAPGCATIFVGDYGTPIQHIPADHRRVCVVQDTITTTDPPVGAGLQNDYEVVLSTAASQAGTVTLTTSTPSFCALGPTDTGPFSSTATVSVSMPLGQKRAPFVVQGLKVGTCTVTPAINLPGYQSVPQDIDVVQPAFRIISLPPSIGSQAANDQFNVEIGVPLQDRRVGVNPQLQDVQPALYGGPGVPVNVCSSDPLVGKIVGADPVTGCRPIWISAGAYESSDTDQNNNLAFDPVGNDPQARSTTVSATSPPDAVPQFYPAAQAVTVRNVVPSVPDHRLGSGLQDLYVLSLNRTLATATTFTITSLDQAACLLAVHETDTGQGSIPISILPNTSRAYFYIHAVAAFIGSCDLTITTSADGISEGYATIPIVNPAAQIINLDPTVSTQSPPDPFNVEIGVPGPRRVSLSDVQDASVDGSGIPLVVCHSGVGSVNGVSNGCLPPVIVPPDASQTLANALVFNPGHVPGPADIWVLGPPYFVHIRNDHIHITVAATTVTVPPHKVGAGLQDAFQLVLSRTLAQSYTFNVSTDTPNVCQVALHPADCGSGVSPIGVPIPAGHSRAAFYVQAMESVIDTCHLLLTAPAGSGVTSGEAFIPIVQPALRIVNLDTSLSSQSKPEAFNVEVGVPTKHLGTLADVQAVRACGPGVSVNVCNYIPPPPAAEVGTIVGEVNGCLPILIIQQSTPTRLAPPIQSPPVYYDPEHVYGSTIITADAPGFIRTDAGSKDVTVAARVVGVHPHQLGAGLQDQFALRLNATLSQSITITVKSNDTGICKVALNSTNDGTDSVGVTIPKGRTLAYFYIQGMEDVIDTCQLSLTPPNGSGVAPGMAYIPAVEPGLQIVNLGGTIKTTAADDGFNVLVGIPGSKLGSLVDTTQVARHGGPGLALKVCNTIPPSPGPEIGSIVGEGPDGCLPVTIQAMKGGTLGGVLAFHPGTITGTTTVYASAPDLISTDAASKDVTVSAATVSLSGPDAVGAGLEDTFTVTVNPKAPSGGLPITLKSCTPSVCLVAKNEDTAAPLTYDQNGCQVYSTSIAKGHTYIHFAIQALENVSDDCIVTAESSDVRYAPDELIVPIVQPGLRIRGLDPTTTVAAKDDPFNVDTGVPKASQADLRLVQSVRPGGPGLTVQVCSTDSTVALLKSGATESGCVTAPVPTGSSGTDDGVLAFDPQTQGNTTIIATAPNVAPPGFVTTDAGSVDVVVAAVALSFKYIDSTRVGSGLMDEFTLKASSAVGANTPITVSAQGPCLVAPNNSTTALGSTTVTIASGATSKNFYIHGLEGATGQCALAASDPAGILSDGFGSYDIVEPAVSITAVTLNKTQASADDAFYVNVGVPKSDLSTLTSTANQVVRYGSSGFGVTVCSSDPGVGLIVSSTGVDVCGSATIVANDNNTTSTALKFRVAGNGTTTISPPTPNPVYIVTDAGSQDITVTGFSAVVLNNSSTTSIGAGLEQNSFYVQRTGGTATAATITVSSLTPTVCLVSTSGTVAGASTADVTLPAGSANSNTFWIQALETAGFTCQVQTVVGPYVNPGAVSVPIVQPAIQLSGVATSIVYNAALENFYVQIGVASGTTFQTAQPVRGGRAPFVITVQLTDDPADTQHPAQLISAFSPTGQQVTTQIPGGSASNTALLQFQPLATGNTACSASGTGVISTDTATVGVAVTSGGC
jgi:hypothetical protein